MKRLIRTLPYLLLTLSLLISACGQQTGQNAKRIAADYPAVDGSTSAHPLQRVVACAILGVPCTWSAQTSENVQRTIIPDPDANVPEESAQAIEAVTHNGTHGSYMNLIEGAADVILVAREPSPDELQAAQEQNVTLDAQPVALDAFVFLVNVQNPIENLSIETIRQIYTGEITTWAELGITIDPASGTEEPIHAYQRNRNSGSQELMDDLVMQGASMIDTPDLITTSMVGPFNAIGGNPWTGDGDILGLGYSIYYYTTSMFPHEYVRMIAVGDVQPTSETIASRTYPLTTEVYVVVREGTPQDSTAMLLRDWLLTEDGQAVVEESGYIPIK